MQTILNEHNNYKLSMKTQFFILVLGVLLTSTICAAESGDVAPVCNITDFTTQKPININDYKGKVIYLDFWASWCIPCRRENPNIVAAYEEYHEKGFDVGPYTGSWQRFSISIIGLPPIESQLQFLILTAIP